MKILICTMGNRSTPQTHLGERDATEGQRDADVGAGEQLAEDADQQSHKQVSP